MTAIGLFIARLLAPFRKYLAVFGVVAAALTAVFLRGRSSGRTSMKAEQAAHIQKIERQWDAIDRTPGDARAAFDSLRRRNRTGR